MPCKNMAALLVDCFCAGVVELADASDSKSEEAQPRAGSIPASGTSFFKKVLEIFLSILNLSIHHIPLKPNIYRRLADMH